MIPISKNVLEPIIKTNVQYVNSLEEFEKIELQPNETILRFDNNKACFYVKERNGRGEYSNTKIYFYEDFAEKVENIKKKEFIQKCKNVGFDDLKTECACMFFLENKKPQDVWLWLLSNGKKDCEWDTVKKLKYRIKTALFPELVRHKRGQVVDTQPQK